MPKSAVFLLLLGLIVRLAWALLQPTSSAAIDRLPDQREYLSLAENVLHHGALSFVDARFGQTVYAYRMPGYPLFLAACGCSLRMVRVVQSFIDTSTLLAIFLIARRLLNSQRAGVIALALLAINPFYIYFSGLILTETLFACLLAWAVWFLIGGRWIVAVFFLIAGVYVRPSGLLFLLLVLPFKANSTTQPAYPLLDVLRRGILSTLLTFACLLPWIWRNHQILGTYVFTTTNGGVTLNDGFSPTATGGSDQRFITMNSGLKSITEVERDAFFQSQASDWISQHWRSIPALSARKILRGWSPVTLSQEFGRTLYRVISAAYSLPFDLLCVLGLFSRRINLPGKMLMTMPALIVTLAQIASVGSIRYRMPAEAMLAVLAAAGVVVLFDKKSAEEPRLE